MFTIHNTSLAAWLADHLTPHTFPLLDFQPPAILLHQVLHSPHIFHCRFLFVIVISLSCWLIPACAPAISLLASSCYLSPSNAPFTCRLFSTHILLLAIGYHLPCHPLNAILFTFEHSYATTCSWLITACITTIGILPTFYGIPRVLQHKIYSLLKKTHLYSGL